MYETNIFTETSDPNRIQFKIQLIQINVDLQIKPTPRAHTLSPEALKLINYFFNQSSNYHDSKQMSDSRTIDSATAARVLNAVLQAPEVYVPFYGAKKGLRRN